MALFPPKAGSPSWDVSSLNQLWDLVDGTDFLVGLCAPKTRSPSFNALRIKQGRPVHSSRAPLHNTATFVANKRPTRKEWSNGRINLLEASPQVSHHFSCRMSSWIVAQKARLSVREAVFFSPTPSLFILFNAQRNQSVKRFWNTVRRKLCFGSWARVSVFVQTTQPVFRLRLWGLHGWLKDWIQASLLDSEQILIWFKGGI